MFDYRRITSLPIWKINTNHTNQITLFVVAQVCGIVVAQLMAYLMRLFGKMTVSQIWYIGILELSGNHDLLDQYLYSLLSREPLYLMITFPFFVLRIIGYRADKMSGPFKDWMVYNVKQIVYKLFGAQHTNP